MSPDKDVNAFGPDQPVNLTENSHKWKTEGIAIVVAGITNIKLFVYDYVEKMIAVEEDLDVLGDIGSYLNVMELVKKQKKKLVEDHNETYSMFVGTTEGEINIFEIQFTINYNNPVLAEFGKELREVGQDIMRKSRKELGWNGQDSDKENSDDEEE
jgi:hypothetical protein